MTCEAVLELMLEADLDALGGAGNSPVATHLRECGRCRAVAEQLLADTRALAVAVEAASREAAVPERHRAGMRRRVPHGRYLIVGSLAAAALAFVMVRRSSDQRTGVAVHAAPGHATLRANAAASDPSSVTSHAEEPPASPPLHAAPPPAGTASGGTRTSMARASSPSLIRSTPHPFPPAQPVPATPIMPRVEPEPTEGVARGVVSVHPPQGKRVAVVRARDQAVTVVWLY
jgi:hypothetical protein